VSLKPDFASLPGDPSKSYTAYGPEASQLVVNPAKASGGDEDEDIDLFGSDDEEDAEAAKIREERLAEYNKKKATKVKPAAKSIVSLDVKPWGNYVSHYQVLNC
jgi:elongation factor 1-beta